jgi:hypothetical protein
MNASLGPGRRNPETGAAPRTLQTTTIGEWGPEGTYCVPESVDNNSREAPDSTSGHGSDDTCSTMNLFPLSLAMVVERKWTMKEPTHHYGVCDDGIKGTE